MWPFMPAWCGTTGVRRLAFCWSSPASWHASSVDPFLQYAPHDPSYPCYPLWWLRNTFVATDTHNTLVHASRRLEILMEAKLGGPRNCRRRVFDQQSPQPRFETHILAQLSPQKHEKHTLYRKVHCRWGCTAASTKSDASKFKRFQVKPSASLSLQKCHHHTEHWIVVSSTAEITNGDQVMTLTENNPPTYRWAKFIVSLIAARFRWKSLRCNRAATWVKTILCDLKMFTEGKIKCRT